MYSCSCEKMESDLMGIFHIFFAVSSLFPKNQDGQKQSAVGKSSGPSNFKNPLKKGAANQAPFRINKITLST